jgi:hypothetical protein
VKRRDFVSFAVAAAVSGGTGVPVGVPVHRLMDAHARPTADQIHRFWSAIWPETGRDFGRCGVRLETTDGAGEVRRTAADRPVFIGLRPRAINLVLTDHIPMYWDRGRSSAGVTTIFEGYHICMIALQYAHGHQVPWISLNTCTHELLHAILGDIFVGSPKWYQSGEREVRADWDATRMWLFGGADIRAAAQAYVKRLAALP